MIYFIQAGENGPIKIGKSDDPERRLKQLQTAHHKELKLLWVEDGAEEKESAYHEDFKDHNIKNEWFRPDPIIDFLCGEVKMYPVKVFWDGNFHNMNVRVVFGCEPELLIKFNPFKG